MTAVLAYTDGYSISMDIFDSAEAAQKAMQTNYDILHVPELDEDNESYIDAYSARCVITGVDIHLWAIRIVK